MYIELMAFGFIIYLVYCREEMALRKAEMEAAKVSFQFDIDRCNYSG